MTIDIRSTGAPKQKPDDAAPLSFGVYTTDHMLVMEWTREQGWGQPSVIPYGDLSLDPAALTLHYGQAVFDGFKAFATADGGAALFRPDAYMARLNQSARRLDMPELPVGTTLAAVERFVDLERGWIPTRPDSALYLRPTMIATEPHIGVKSSDRFLFFVIASPVGAYYAEGFSAVKIKVEDEFVRAAPGGLGAAKTPANYAASLLAGRRAKSEGYAQVLWLDAVERRWVEEVGSMNIFFRIAGKVITPPLTGSILPGVTRQCVIEMLAADGVAVQERRIDIEEVISAHEDGMLQEVFGSGTAAVISSVGLLHYRGKDYPIGDGTGGELASKLFRQITGIQYGRDEDRFGWLAKVPRVE
ncbi:MAG: branched-chain amino acid aminotransferase [Nitrospinae bacterium]|nr:branched-chain amino acid aminotransferase [Nitrospinota bacterium]